MWLRWAEWKHLVCAVLGLHAWMFGVLSSPFSLLLSYTLTPFSQYYCLSFATFFFLFVVVTAQCYVQNYFFFFCILPYPWASNLALITYHCHPLNFENCHLKTWYNGRDFFSPINLLLQGIFLGFFPGILCMNFVLCIARVLFIF